VLFEENVGHLARHVENTLRKHGREIAQQQFVQRRIADVAIDLFGLAACLSRTTQAIEREGEEKAQRQIEWTRSFANEAQKRLLANVAGFESNDDELRKSIAALAYEDGCYPLDVI